MMKRLLFALLLTLAPSLAWAQCNGVFPAQSLCGNPNLSPTQPTVLPISAFGLTAGGITVGVTPVGSAVNGGVLYALSGILQNNGPLVGAVSNPTANGQWSIGATTTLGIINIGQGSVDDGQWQNSAGTGVISIGHGATVPTLNGITGSNQCLQVNTTGVMAGSGGACGGAPGSPTSSVQYNNAGAFAGFGVYTSGSHTLELDAADAATTNAQTLSVQSIVAGTANAAGSLWTQQGSQSTGNAAPGNLTFNTGFQGWPAATALQSISNASPAVFTTASPHNFFVNQAILLTTTGTLPTGLSTLTTYYIISAGFTSTQFEVATSLGGSAVNTSSAGSGTHTATPGAVVTISNSSPALIQISGSSGFASIVPGVIVQFQSTGTLPTGLSTSTNYFVIAQGLQAFLNQFEVSATLNGPAINTSSAGSGTFTFTVQGGTTVNTAQPTVVIGPNSVVAQSAATPALQINQNWNYPSLFTHPAALFVNVQDGAQGQSGFLARFAYNGNTFFTVGNPQLNGNANGLNLNFNGGYANPALVLGSGNSQHQVYTNTNNNGATAIFGVGQTGGEFQAFSLTFNNTMNFPNNLGMGWLSGGDPSLALLPDTILYRDAAVGVLALGDRNSSTTATALRVYATTDQVGNNTAPTNYSRGIFDAGVLTANTLTVGSQANGTGTKMSVAISPANGHTTFVGGVAPTANSCAGFTLGTGSSDGQGTITYTSATTCSITFGTAYTNAPFCQITPGSAASTVEVVSITTGFTATFGTAQTAFSYRCSGV